MTILIASTAALPILAVAGMAVHIWRRHTARPMTVTEWREGMRKLEQGKPPKFLSRYASRGAAGICYPEPKRVSRKIAVLRKTGTRGETNLPRK